jgi:hypothetical protein
MLPRDVPILGEARVARLLDLVPAKSGAPEGGPP